MALSREKGFRAPIHMVLDGARDADLFQVAIIGTKRDGSLYVAASTSTEVALALFAAAPAEIERLASEDAD